MDALSFPGVDIQHDIEIAPWPIESDSCEVINASHVFEHLKPWKLFDVTNEAWRVMKVGGFLAIRTPYGAAYAFDPTHCILFQESSFLYLDPSTPYHEIYKPRPWEVVGFERDEINQELKTILKKRAQA